MKWGRGVLSELGELSDLSACRFVRLVASFVASA